MREISRAEHHSALQQFYQIYPNLDHKSNRGLLCKIKNLRKKGESPLILATSENTEILSPALPVTEQEPESITPVRFGAEEWPEQDLEAVQPVRNRAEEGPEQEPEPVPPVRIEAEEESKQEPEPVLPVRFEAEEGPEHEPALELELEKNQSQDVVATPETKAQESSETSELSEASEEDIEDDEEEYDMQPKKIRKLVLKEPMAKDETQYDKVSNIRLI